MLSEINQTEKYCMISRIDRIFKKNPKLVNITKKEQTHRFREQPRGLDSNSLIFLKLKNQVFLFS